MSKKRKSLVFVVVALIVFAIVTLSTILFTPSSVNASCGNRPGTPDQVKAEPSPGAPTSDINFSWRNTTRGDSGYFDIYFTDGNGQPVGGNLTGTGPYRGISYGSRSTYTLTGLAPGTRRCFSIRARTEGGRQGCVSRLASAQACATTLLTPPPYPATVENYLKNSAQMQQVIITIWNNAGRAITAEQVQQAVNGKQFRKGVRAYNAHANIGDIQSSWKGNSANLSVQIRVPGNNVEFKTTTPTVFGSYADPSFRVGFGLVVDLAVVVTNTATPIRINQLNVQVQNASIRGSNAVGTLVETVGDFFTSGEFSRNIVSRINSSQDLKDKVAQAIRSTLNTTLVGT